MSESLSSCHDYEDSDVSVSQDAMSQDEKAQNADREYFAYMLANYDAAQKINTYIGKSRDPFLKVDLINEKMTRGARSTRQAAGNWRLEMIVGPFVTKKESVYFRELWKQKSRGILSRLERGMNLAEIHKKTCWDASKGQDEEMVSSSEISDYDFI